MKVWYYNTVEIPFGCVLIGDSQAFPLPPKIVSKRFLDDVEKNSMFEVV